MKINLGGIPIEVLFEMRFVEIQVHSFGLCEEERISFEECGYHN